MLVEEEGWWRFLIYRPQAAFEALISSHHIVLAHPLVQQGAENSPCNMVPSLACSLSLFSPSLSHLTFCQYQNSGNQLEHCVCLAKRVSEGRYRQDSERHDIWTGGTDGRDLQHTSLRSDFIQRSNSPTEKQICTCLLSSDLRLTPRLCNCFFNL